MTKKRQPLDNTDENRLTIEDLAPTTDGSARLMGGNQSKVGQGMVTSPQTKLENSVSNAEKSDAATSAAIAENIK
jgi:hypothetical protein